MVRIERTITLKQLTENYILFLEGTILWKFIDALRRTQAQRDHYHEQLIAGHLPPPKANKYLRVDEIILQIYRLTLN